MAMHSTHAAADEHDDSVHHEGSDINIRAIVISAIALFVMTAFAYGAVLVTFKILDSRAKAESATPLYPLAVGQQDRLPPLPRLQTNPKQELRDLRAEEARTLDNYQWVDKSAGVVRIPIEEAMKLTVQRGLASRPASAPAAAPAASAGTAAPAAAEQAR